jgi:histidine kinase
MILKQITSLRHRLAFKLIVAVGLLLLITISIWSYFSINYQERELMDNVVSSTDRLTTTIKLGTHYAMTLNSRDDLTQIIANIGRQEDIENVRIYNKQGEIKFSNRASEVETSTNIKAEACYICHRTDPPLTDVPLKERIRIFRGPEGVRYLGVISPIFNEPGCSTEACHVHPEDKKILGALDVVVSLKNTDQEIRRAEKGMLGLAGFVFLLTSAIIFVFVMRFVNRPVRKLIEGSRLIALGHYPEKVDIDREDEMGELAAAMGRMSSKIAEKQAELNAQRDEYQTLFEHVPCLITVQDRNFRMLRYNHEFAARFDPSPGDYCFQAYKGLDRKCSYCPVELTFADGQPHHGEEAGMNKDGTLAHWLFRTTPIRNAEGEIIAALEMSLDITERKQLEERLEKSERKYHEIFNHIPNPVFVLDIHTLEIVDCNESVPAVYGFDKHDVIGRSFLDLFPDEEKDRYADELKTVTVLNQVKQMHRDGRTIFVNIRSSPSEYPGKEVLLVTTSDITKRLEAEQQLIQASKMATLGEMATGVAHELNQPLSVMKTASSFFLRKLDHAEPIDPSVLANMLRKIDANVDRATRIINHMRQFARKSEMQLEKVQLNQVLEKAFDIFSQQLKVRGIEVRWELDDRLPKILADPGRLEQVFINLLLNARDAIEEKWGAKEPAPDSKGITLKTRCDGRRVICEVCDTGKGVPIAIADKIFEPFFTTKEVGKGTGLGLSISYGIVQDCQGNIRVVPNRGGGACFVVEFPVADKKE